MGLVGGILQSRSNAFQVLPTSRSCDCERIPTAADSFQPRPTRRPLIRNEGVAGSSPACGTTIFTKSLRILLYYCTAKNSPLFLPIFEATSCGIRALRRWLLQGRGAVSASRCEIGYLAHFFASKVEIEGMELAGRPLQGLFRAASASPAEAQGSSKPRWCGRPRTHRRLPCRTGQPKPVAQVALPSPCHPGPVRAAGGARPYHRQRCPGLQRQKRADDVPDNPHFRRLG